MARAQRARGLVLALVASSLGACGPDDLSGTVRAWVFTKGDDHEYRLRVGDVEHLESLRALRGRDIEVRRGTEISLGLVEAEIDRGGPFDLAWTLDEDGAVVPADLYSLQALNMYRAFDRAATALRAHGHEPVRRLLVYFLPRMDSIVLGDERLLLTDNAAYFSLGEGFLVVPSFVLSDLPMMLNEGVLAHEYGHAVVQQRMFGAESSVPHEGEPGWARAGQHLLAMHEGVADLVGFVVSGDPDFISPTVEADRDISKPLAMTDEDFSLMDTPPDADDPLAALLPSYDPHWQGSLLARAVYEMWPKSGENTFTEAERGHLLDEVLAALDGLGWDERFSLARFPDALAGRLPAQHRYAACKVLRERLSPLMERIESCKGL